MPTGPALAGPGRMQPMPAPAQARTASDAARLAAQRSGQAPVQAADPDALNRLARNAARSGATAPPLSMRPRSPFAPQAGAQAPVAKPAPQQMRPQMPPQGYPQAYPQSHTGVAHSPVQTHPQAAPGYHPAYPQGYPAPYPQPQVQVTPHAAPPQTAQRSTPPRGPARVRR